MKHWVLWGITVMTGAFLAACNWQPPQSNEGLVDTLATTDSLQARSLPPPPDSLQNLTASTPQDQTQQQPAAPLPPTQQVDVGTVHPDELIAFAETLKGIPYKYGSTDPKAGFDCSGFITYVFNHFGISVPRSSIDFTDVGQTIPRESAKRGDIILFTGTDSTERFVGHMGLIVSNTNGQIEFIHSTSGKAWGVTVTPLNKYYMSRFVKTLRIFPQNDISTPQKRV